MPEPQHDHADRDTEHHRHHGAERERSGKRQRRPRLQQGGGIGADAEECRLADVELPRDAHQQVVAGREDAIDRDQAEHVEQVVVEQRDDRACDRDDEDGAEGGADGSSWARGALAVGRAA